jgi:hypothetical protein
MCLRRAPEKYIAGAALDRAVVVGLGDGRLSLVNTIEELLKGKSRDSGLRIR